MQFSEDRPSTLDDFPVPRVRLVATTVVMVLVASITILVSAGSLAAGATTGPLAGFAFAVFALVVPVFAWNNEPSRCTGSRARRSVDKSSVRYEPMSLPILALVMASSAAMAVFFGVSLDGPMGWVFVALGALSATFLIPVLLTHTVRRGGVELTAKGIRHRAWAYEAEVAWTDVVDITFARRAYPAIWVLVSPAAPITQKYTTRFWRIERIPVPHVVELDCRRFDVHPVALAQWLTFYTFTPAARVELGTDAAADRLAAIGI